MLHKSMGDMRAPERSGLKKMVSHAYVVVRKDPDIYEAEMSPERERWVRARIGELRSLLKKLKRWLVMVQKRKMPIEYRRISGYKKRASTQVEVVVSKTSKEAQD